MKYRAVLFDFDYTLGDATVGIVESFRFALGTMGFALPAELDIKKTVGLSLAESFERITGQKDAALAEEFRQLFKQKADEVMTTGTVLFGDTVETLQALQNKKIKTGIVTSKYHYRITDILKRFSAAHLIETIVGGEDVKNLKPDPEGLFLAAKNLCVPLKETLYVGDSEVDAAAAREAKVDFCAVLTGTTGRDIFEKYPHAFIVRDLSELMKFLKTIDKGYL